MSVILLISILIRILATGWSIVLWRRVRDRRMLYMTLVLFLMATRQVETLITATAETGQSGLFLFSHISELTALLVSIMAFFAVFFIERIFSDRIRAEEALRDSEKLFRSLTETSGDWIWEVDQTGVYTYVSQKVKDVLGYEPEQVVGKTPIDFMPPHEAERVGAIFRTIMASGRSLERLENVNLHRDGQIVALETSGIPILDESENLLGYRGVDRDITDRKRTEEELRKRRDENTRLAVIAEERRELQDWINTFDTFVGKFDSDGIGILFNKSPIEAGGVTEDEVVGKYFPDTKWWSHSERERARIVECFERAKTGLSSRMETNFRSVAGTPIPIIFNCHPVMDNDGKVKYVTAEGKTIIEEKRLRTELEERALELNRANIQLKELDELKSMFIAGMSHELRTPLNSIIGFTGMILQGMAGEINREQTKQLTMVKNSANHLLALINEVIDVSKMESGRVELHIEEFDLSALMQEVKNSFQVTTIDNDIELLLDAPERLIIKSDERRTKQVLMNLVSNAVKFTDRGKIKMRAVKINENVEMSVRDTGIGIRKEHMKLLFKSFSRIRDESRPIQEGTGLGLYLSKRTADLLGGEIKAESTFGEGSEFVFSLPLIHEGAKI